jgi:hypothetical protein
MSKIDIPMMKPKPEGVISRKDGDQYKRFPNGLKATLKAIRKFWNPKERWEFRPGVGKTPLVFAQAFAAAFNRVGSYYGGAEKTPEKIAGAIRKLEGSGKKQISDITFWKIRAYAEYVELPTSLFLLFAQMTSYEAQSHSREEIQSFLRRCIRALSALDAYITKEEKNSELFHHQIAEDINHLEYIAVLKGLYLMRDAFGKWEDRLVAEPIKSRVDAK